MPYIPLTETERQQMLQAIGVASMDDLWEQAGVLEPKPELKRIPHGRSEFEISRYLGSLAHQNATDLTGFLGNGFYDHYIPPVVQEILGRGEFYTAYTPYQAEASQGTLQAIYEFQSGICRLTNMEVANASMYDGGTALFEAMMMAVRITRRRRAVVLGSVSPIYLAMIRCYCRNLDVELKITDARTLSSRRAVERELTEDTACILVQYPNVFGAIEDFRWLTEAAAKKKIISVCSTYPVALGLITPPGDMGFDIVTGEGQSLGLPLSFGGPYLGFMATRQKHLRKLPGRVVGRTVDADDNVAYTLTLQTREQHIRREKATSNICTNEGLCALAATAYMTAVGRRGFRRLAETCAAKAAYTREQLAAIDGVQPLDAPFFNEFVVSLPFDATEVVSRMVDRGYAPGFPLGYYYRRRKRELLVALTEKRTREEIRGLAVALEAVLSEMS